MFTSYLNMFLRVPELYNILDRFTATCTVIIPLTEQANTRRFYYNSNKETIVIVNYVEKLEAMKYLEMLNVVIIRELR